MLNGPLATNKREIAVFVLGLVLLAAVAMRPSIRGNDGVGNYVYLASILRGGDLDFGDEYHAFDALKQYPYHFRDLPKDPRTGRPTNRYGIGSALLWAPFVVATHWALLIFQPTLATGMSRPYEWAVGLGTVFWGSLALGMLYFRLRRDWGRLAAAATLTGLVLATPLGFYLYAHGSMSHGTSFFAMTGAMLAFERAWRAPRPGLMAACGFWCALLVMIRFQDATWALVLGGALAWRFFALQANKDLDSGVEANPSTTPWIRQSLNLGLFGLAFFLVFLPQMVVWKVLYGSWFSGPAPYLNDSAGSFSSWPRHWLEALVGERGGVLAWHPLYVLGLIGLFLLARGWPFSWHGHLARDTERDMDALARDSGDSGSSQRTQTHGQDARATNKALAVVGLIGFAAQVWLVGSWSIWWAGASFGNRMFLSALPFLALGIAQWWSPVRPRRQRLLLLILLGALIVWNLGLLIQYATEMFPREAPYPWSKVIRQNMIDVPRWLWRHIH